MTKIAFVGSCQVGGLAVATRHLLPGAEVKSWHVGVSPSTSAEIAAELPGFDLVVTQIADSPNALFSLSQLRQRRIEATYLPTFVFMGLHPDLSYIPGPTGPLKGALLIYHSTIAAASFLNGYDADRTERLYNAFIFSLLGYYDISEASKYQTTRTFAEAGYDITTLFDAWLTDINRFVYTINHPQIRVLADLAKLVLVKAGLISYDTPIPKNIPDYLERHARLPIYPAIAKRYGQPGSLMFRVKAPGGANFRDATLRENIEATFSYYANLEREQIDQGHITAARMKLADVVLC